MKYLVRIDGGDTDIEVDAESHGHAAATGGLQLHEQGLAPIGEWIIVSVRETAGDAEPQRFKIRNGRKS